MITYTLVFALYGYFVFQLFRVGGVVFFIGVAVLRHLL